LTQLQKNNTNFIIFALQTMAPFRHPLHFVSVVKEGYDEHGQLSEWLGIGLQNRLRRFESATDLNQSLCTKCCGIFCFREGRFTGLINETKNTGSASAERDWLKGAPPGSPKVIRETGFYSICTLHFNTKMDLITVSSA
jgi:hypothetical protein